MSTCMFHTKLSEQCLNIDLQFYNISQCLNKTESNLLTLVITRDLAELNTRFE